MSVATYRRRLYRSCTDPVHLASQVISFALPSHLSADDAWRFLTRNSVDLDCFCIVNLTSPDSPLVARPTGVISLFT